MLGLLAGIFAWLNLDVSYWNWDGFPSEFVLGSLADQAVGWLAAGAVIALLVGKKTVAST